MSASYQRRVAMIGHQTLVPLSNRIQDRRPYYYRSFALDLSRVGLRLGNHEF